MSLGSSQCTSLYVILFDVSPQANKILQAIHLSKLPMQEIPICQMRTTHLYTLCCTQKEHCITCTAFLEVKQSSKLTTKRWWIFGMCAASYSLQHCKREKEIEKVPSMCDIVSVFCHSHIHRSRTTALRTRNAHEYEIYCIPYLFAISLSLSLSLSHSHRVVIAIA